MLHRGSPQLIVWTAVAHYCSEQLLLKRVLPWPLALARNRNSMNR